MIGLSVRDIVSLLDAEEADAPSVETAADGLSDLLRILNAHGFLARVVTVTPAEIRDLRRPCAIELRDRSWLWLSDDGHVRPSVPAWPSHMAGFAVELWGRTGTASSLWRILATRLGKNRAALFGLAGLIVAMQAVGFAGPLLVRVALDRALPLQDTTLLHIVVAAMCLAVGMTLLLGWMRASVLVAVQADAEFLMGLSFLRRLADSSSRFLGTKTIGDLMQSYSGLTAARNLVVERSVTVAVDAATMASGIAALLVVFPLAIAPIVAAIAAIWLIVAIVGQRQSAVIETSVAAQAKQRTIALEVLCGIATIKACRASGAVLRKWVTSLETELAGEFRRQQISLWADGSLEVVRMGFVVAVVTALVWTSGIMSSIGTVVATVQVALMVLGAAGSMASSYLTYVGSRPLIKRANEVFDAPRERRSSSVRANRDVAISMKGLWFRYAEHLPWVLENYDLRVQHGEQLRLAGPSGSGKTTILRLIAGINEPDRGDVAVGCPTANGGMLYLPQFVRLYGGSILDNLRYLSGRRSLDALMEAANESGLHAWASTLPMGYRTLLAQGGGTISGGQRQLIALTAVLASKATVLLLDEPTSNLDRQLSEGLLQNRLLRDRTLVYASHSSMG